MIALIAGTGALPAILADALVAQGDPPIICAMEGFPPNVRPGLQHLNFRIETLGTLLQSLHRRGVTRICLAGAVRRPVINPDLIDAATRPLIAALIAAMAKGDDGTLRGIMALLEAAGFALVGADQIVPELLPLAKVYTRISPTAMAQHDVRIGLAEVARMGQSDIGQACVIVNGLVKAHEDAEGTDVMLRSLCAPNVRAVMTSDPIKWVFGQLAGLLSASPAPLPDASGGILVKAPKPGQDRRADLPVIGPATAMLAAEAGLAGIVIAAGGVMVIDLPQVVEILDGQGLFLWVFPSSAADPGPTA